MTAFTEMSFGTCQKVVKKELHFFPYKMSAVQELRPLDYEKRIQYCNWFNQHLTNNAVLDLCFFSDEAWFHLTGYINSQNYRTWSAENPHVTCETRLHPVKIGVWVAMSRRRLIGPVFFENNINANHYREILHTFVDQLHDDELQQGYFQHDNATPHTAGHTLQYLQEFYGNRLITSGLWPPRSPDLTPLDYFLFGHLKTTIYRNRLHTLNELKEAITTAIRSITPQQLTNVFNNMQRRVAACIENDGNHFEHLL